MLASKAVTAHAFLCLVLLLAGIASNAGAYGTSPDPGEINEMGTFFEINGISLQASEEIYARLSVTHEFIMTYVGEKPGSTIDLTIGGLPSGEEHYVYVDTHDEYLSTTTGSITLSLDLNAARLIWVQPFLSTIYIGGVSDQCFIVGIRDGDTCTLTTDVIGTVEIAADNQVLDCNLHYILQDSGGSGSGIGVFIGNRQNVEVRDCKIGRTGQSFGPGFFSWHSDNVTVSGSDFESNDSNIALSASSFCHVFGNVIFGSNARVGIGMTDDSHDNEVYDNDVTVEVLPDAMGIWHSGGVPPTLAHDNLIYGNTIHSSSSGIGFRNATENELYGNTIYADANELIIQESGWPNRFYHNNIMTGPQKVFSTIPAELSWEGEGNFWSRSCPGDLFVPGGDSNSLDVVDSYPYGQQDAWDLGQSPGCGVFPDDWDGDGILDANDNCLFDWNPGQENIDGVQEGDACDVNPPASPEIAFPVDGDIYFNPITTIVGTAEQFSRVVVTRYGDLIADGYTNGFGYFALDVGVPISIGYHSIQAISMDAAENTSGWSNEVDFSISPDNPPPPIIESPVDGAVVHSNRILVSGITNPTQVVTIFIAEVPVSDGAADDNGEFQIQTPILEDGYYTFSATTTDGYGRTSVHSTPVNVQVLHFSEESPIIGIEEKLEIHGISDSPDPFHPGYDEVSIQVIGSVSATDGLGGNSPNHSFYSSLRLSIRDHETGSEIESLEDLLDITDVSSVEGRVNLAHLLKWDGKDSGGIDVAVGKLFDYFLELEVVKIHRNPRSRCGREPCIVDAIEFMLVGSMLSSDYKFDAPYSISVRAPFGGNVKAILFTDYDFYGVLPLYCSLWYTSLINEDPLYLPVTNYLPDAIQYDSTQIGGIPLINFIPSGTPEEMLASSAASNNFAVSIYNSMDVDSDLVFDYLRIGSSTLLDKEELYPYLPPDLLYGSHYWYWWGRNTDVIYNPDPGPAPHHILPEIISHDLDAAFYNPYSTSQQPYDFTTRYYADEYHILLDVYNHGGRIRERDDPICMARFFYLQEVNDIPAFIYEEAPHENPQTVPEGKRDCEYPPDKSLFDPFNFDGVPNTFTDALLLPGDDPDDLLPRIQLMAPGNNQNYDSGHPMEKWCNDNTYACDFTSTATEDAFKNDLRILDPDYMPSEHFTPRHRSLHWYDNGPWRKPHIYAAMETSVSVLLRRESEALPDDVEDVVCTSETDDPTYRPIAWLEYIDTSGGYHEPTAVNIVDGHYGTTISYSYTDSATGVVYDLMVPMNCRVVDDYIDPWDSHDVDWIHTNMNLYGAEGVAFFPLNTIKIPADAKGEARIVWEGKVARKYLTGPSENTQEERHYPIYINPIEETTGTSALNEATPACWIGATRNEGGFPDYAQVGEDDTYSIPSVPFESYGYSDVYHWLYASDLGPWTRVTRSEGESLYSLYGDSKFYWNNAAINFGWYQNRGSTLTFRQEVDGSGAPQYVTGYNNPGYRPTFCPVMVPELIDDDYPGIETMPPELNNDRLPWTMLRSDGFNFENGRFNAVTERIEECTETGAETVQATTAFQTTSQRDEAWWTNGDSFVWFFGVSDWGSFETHDDEQNAMFPWNSVYHRAYERASPQWYSFIGVWQGNGGLDDLGRSVMWDHTLREDGTMDWSTFINVAAVPVDDLSMHIDNSTEAIGPGVLVWHAGRQRNSPLYFSFVRQSDVLLKDKYWHFGGITNEPTPRPIWTPFETLAFPVFWDDVGEFSAVYYNEDGRDPYKVIYGINSGGQAGIVMRESEHPWGSYDEVEHKWVPYSNAIPLFDPVHMQFREFIDATGAITTTMVRPGGACYGGYTNTKLWEDAGPEGTLIRFNSSMWAPYKVLLVETLLPLP